MPRKARVESRTDVYHIMERGNNKDWVFKESYFKRLYLEKMQTVVATKSLEIYAWCIMDNHVHMVLKGDLNELATSMKAINGCFAQKYNQKMKRVGHALQDRYRSEVVEDDGYFKGVIRYVHQNPIKAGIVKTCGDYQWSSYNKYIKASMQNHSINILKAYFNDDLNTFENYHCDEDNHEYLDTKETIIKQRITIAQSIIQYYSERYQLTSIYDLNRHINLRNTLIVEISKKSRLQYSKIGQLCGVSYSTVYEVIKKAEDIKLGDNKA